MQPFSFHQNNHKKIKLHILFVRNIEMLGMRDMKNFPLQIRHSYFVYTYFYIFCYYKDSSRVEKRRMFAHQVRPSMRVRSIRCIV